MAREVPGVLVGAGTVHTVGQAEEAVEAGARFIVTPGFNPAVVSWCVENGVEVLPGVVSPADIEQALSFGLTTLKFFPAEAYGGVKTLKALSGPYAGVKFMPTGGVNLDNMRDYLDLGNVAAVGGSFMLPGDLVREKNWEAVAALCRQAVSRMLGFSLLHVGVNTRDAEDSAGVANQLGGLFGLPVTEYPGAYFAGSLFEVMKGQFLGAKGHIGIRTEDIDRAVAHFERRGIPFNPDTFNRDGKGLVSCYFRDEIAGFAVHLRRK